MVHSDDYGRGGGVAITEIPVLDIITFTRSQDSSEGLGGRISDDRASLFSPYLKPQRASVVLLLVSSCRSMSPLTQYACIISYYAPLSIGTPLCVT